MINSNNNTKRGNNSTFSSSQDATSISQCLPLDPINLGNQKYNRSTELKRVLTTPVGNNLESYSEELKNFKESVQDTTKKARCRAKVLEHSISKLEEFRVVKRQRTDPLSNGRSCSGNSSMDNNNNKISNNKNITGLGPKTRIRTSMLDARTEGSATTRQQQVLVVKNREDITNKNDIEIEEQLPKKLLNVGGSDEVGWEEKMRRKRSVGGVNNKNNSNYSNSSNNTNTNICNNINDSNNNNSNNNINNNNNKRAANGNREIKRATLVKPSGDSELQSVEAQSFRSKASAANSGITVVESSMPANLSSRLTQRIELEKSLSNIEIDSPAGNPMNTNVMKNKVARTTRTNSSEQNNNNNNIIRTAPVNFEKNQKHSISMSSSSSSANHVARWGGQRPLKISRTRRSNLAFPVSNSNENQEAHPQPSDLIPQTPSVISEGEECRGEIKSKENGSDAGEVRVIPNQKNRKNLLHPRKNKILGNKGAGEKINNLPLPKPLQSSRRIPDKTRSKSSNHRVPKNRRATVRPGIVLNYGSVDFTGDSDDREQLLAAANYARNSNNLACSSPLWKKMEHYFASITSQDASYIKDQLNLAEERNGNLSQMLDDEYNAVSVLMNQTKANKKSVKTKSPSLYQRLLSALIEDDENEEPYLQSEVRNISFQSASDDSHCGSCNQMETEIKERDYNNNNKVESEVESGADFHTHSKHFMDRNSCSNEQWQADDGFSYSSSQIDSFDHQYESLSLDDRLLMELQSIGLCPVIMPHLEETEELNQDITDLQASLFQQVGKLKKHLGKIEEAIPGARSAERRKMEQAAMNQLVEMAYKRRMAYRGNESSKTVIRRVSKQAGLAFTRRTLDRCRKFEETGKSCFTDPAIQDFLFSAPPLPKNRRKEKTPPQKNADVSNNKEKAQGRTTHPTGPFSRGSGQPEPPVIEDLGGPQVDTDLMSSLLDFEEDGLLDDDCLGGLEIPMDDLTDLQMLM